MVLVSNRLIHTHLKSSQLLSEAFSLLENDVEVQSYLRMSNTMAVKRLGYNDHGPVHSKIISGSALELFKLLTNSVEPSSVMNGVCGYDDARLIVLLGAYLHDIGNAVHRVDHERTGALLASGLLDRILHEIYPDDLGLAYRVKCEVLHTIFSSDDSVPCLSVEAGIVTVADGTDMAEGRSRVPYLSGKNDIHSISAQAINSVSINVGTVKPVSIHVSMENPAGIFQIEEVIGRKIRSSGIPDLVEVIASMNGKEIKTI
jgi:metal-dependent HD superfamily phosphatase/phosphodiesterase